MTISEDLFTRSKAVAPGGVHSPVRAFMNVDATPRFIASSDKAYLTDVDGHKYIDYCMSWGPLLFGHGDEDVREAVLTAIGRGWSYGTAEPYSLELAELMVRELPWIEKVRFVNSGTEAVMSAVRVARAATGRDKIVKFDGCYHGHVDSLLVKAGSGLAEMASPDSAGVSKQTAADTLVTCLGDTASFEHLFAQHKDQIAAVILEPLPANNGLLPQEDSFLESVAKIAHQHGALVIYDEVISGFRIGFGGMAAKAKIKPDLVTYGKVIGGGFPVGAFGGRRDLMDQVAPVGSVYQAGTLSANPVAMSAGLAMLKKLKATDPYAALESRTRKLGDDLEAAARAVSDTPIRVQTAGSLFWVVGGNTLAGRDDAVQRPCQIPLTLKGDYGRLYPKLLEQGIYLAPSGFEVGFMATVHTDEHNAKLVSAFADAWKDL